jgi:Raf kinase inhibitor-like YbhB/YbcL family protein
MKIELTSTAFHDGERIPKAYTGDGKDVSPPLRWSEPPQGTKSFALICDDPDAPRGTWVHWVLFNLPAEQRQLEEATPGVEVLASGAKHGKNDFGKIGYGGPAPPPGKPHRYFFKLYALDTVLDLAPGASKSQLVTAMQGHVLAEGQLMGLYGR